MEKQTFVKLFTKNSNCNFVILTDIAEGRGINGVRYRSYVGLWEYSKYYENTMVCGVSGDCAVLMYDAHKEDSCPTGERVVYLPFGHIVAVEFFQADTPAYHGVYPGAHESAFVDELEQ